MLEIPRREFAASSKPSRPVLLNLFRIPPHPATFKPGSVPTGPHPVVTPLTVTLVVRGILPRVTPPRLTKRWNRSQVG